VVGDMMREGKLGRDFEAQIETRMKDKEVRVNRKDCIAIFGHYVA
jgi:hypothetical protein